MPLIVEDVIKEGITLTEETTPFYIEVESKYLPRPYQVTSTTKAWVEGVVVDVSRLVGPLQEKEREAIEKHVIGRHVKLILVPEVLIAYDRLYFTKESWSILRDTGILPGEPGKNRVNTNNNRTHGNPATIPLPKHNGEKLLEQHSSGNRA